MNVQSHRTNNPVQPVRRHEHIYRDKNNNPANSQQQNTINYLKRKMKKKMNHEIVIFCFFRQFCK